MGAAARIGDSQINFPGTAKLTHTAQQPSCYRNLASRVSDEGSRLNVKVQGLRLRHLGLCLCSFVVLL